MSQQLLAQQASSILSTGVGLYLVVLPLASLAAWLYVVQRLFTGGDLLPLAKRRPAPWGLLEVGLVICGWFLSLVLGLVVAAWLGGFSINGVRLAELTSSQGALLIAVPAFFHWGAVLAMGYALKRFASWDDLGLADTEMLSDIGLGCFAFLLIVPPVLILQNILVAAFPAEAEHPFIEVLRSKSEPPLILAICFAAVATAPFLEEFIYRVVVQGWLERVFCGSFGHEPSEQTPNVGESIDYADTEPTSSEIDSDEPEKPSKHSLAPLSTAAILISSLLFAGAHFGHGTAPVSLFFLALGLGYLYQRTHRVTPCIVVHFLLNAQTMALLLVQVYSGESPATPQ